MTKTLDKRYTYTRKDRLTGNKKDITEDVSILYQAVQESGKAVQEAKELIDKTVDILTDGSMTEMDIVHHLKQLFELTETEYE